MDWFKKPDPKQQMRDNQRDIRKANRELETDRRAMDRREKELEAEIKKAAKSNQPETARVLAKQLVQLRNQRNKSQAMSAKMTGIQMQNNHMYSMGKMAGAMGSTVDTMKTMQKQMPVDKLAKQMRDFQMQQEKMGITEEMMSDTLDAILDEPGDAEEQDAIVKQVLDEIGIETNSKLASIPAVPSSVGSSSSIQTSDDLEKMLAQLRG